jgi:hypothetical protein
MKRIISAFLFTGISVSFFTCTEIPIQLKDPVIPESDRVVLIEELTGASCPNCPKGSAAIARWSHARCSYSRRTAAARA